jgi:uncharacterized Fe-S radical SAM superfamily protein PflX
MLQKKGGLAQRTSHKLAVTTASKSIGACMRCGDKCAVTTASKYIGACMRCGDKCAVTTARKHRAVARVRDASLTRVFVSFLDQAACRDRTL